MFRKSVRNGVVTIIFRGAKNPVATPHSTHFFPCFASLWKIELRFIKDEHLANTPQALAVRKTIQGLGDRITFIDAYRRICGTGQSAGTAI